MTSFEIVLCCILIPTAYVLAYIAGKNDLLGLIGEMILKSTHDLRAENETKETTVAYLCDEKACDECLTGDSRYCYHTLDIHHAVNFEEVAPGKFMERE